MLYRGYAYGDSDFAYALMAALGGMLVVFIIAIIAFFILAYVFTSLALYKMAKRRNIDYAGLAWVPVLSMWILGAIADNINLTRGKKTFYRMFLMILPSTYVLGAVANINAYYFYDFTQMLFAFAGIANFVFSMIALYTIYSDYSSSPGVLTVLSIFFAFIVPFALFSMRNKQPFSQSNANAYNTGYGGQYPGYTINQQNQFYRQAPNHQQDQYNSQNQYYPQNQYRPQNPIIENQVNRPAASQPQIIHSTGSIVCLSGMYIGQRFAIENNEEFVFGRDGAVAHIIIDETADNISKKHCSIRYDGNTRTYWVTDYSSNGTFCSDGVRLSYNVTQPLPVGTVISLGDNNNQFRLD